MTKRSFILLSIFIVVVILGGTFITVYKLYWNEQIKNYVLDLATCGFLSETSCENNPKCEPIYRQIDSAQKTVEFERCQFIPERKKQGLAQAKTLCEQTGGSWERLKSGYYCNCVSNGQNKIWDKDKGCQSIE